MVAIRQVVSNGNVVTPSPTTMSTTAAPVTTTTAVSVSISTVTASESHTWGNWEGGAPPGMGQMATTTTTVTPLAATASAGASGSSQRLSPMAVGGIATGATIAVVLVIALIIGACCYRRKRATHAQVPNSTTGKWIQGALSSSTNSITSFDTRTEVLGHSRHIGQAVPYHHVMAEKRDQVPASFAPQHELPTHERFQEQPSEPSEESVLIGFPEAMFETNPAPKKPRRGLSPNRDPEAKRGTSNLRSLILPSWVARNQKQDAVEMDGSHPPTPRPQPLPYHPAPQLKTKFKKIGSHDYHALSPITDKTSHPSVYSESSVDAQNREMEEARARPPPPPLPSSAPVIPALSHSSDSTFGRSPSFSSVFSPLSSLSGRNQTETALPRYASKELLKSAISKPLPYSPSASPSLPPSTRTVSKAESSTQRASSSSFLPTDLGQGSQTFFTNTQGHLGELYNDIYETGFPSPRPGQVIPIQEPDLDQITSSTLAGATVVRVSSPMRETRSPVIHESEFSPYPEHLIGLQNGARSTSHGSSRASSVASKRVCTDRCMSKSTPSILNAPFAQKHHRNFSGVSVATHRSMSPPPPPPPPPPPTNLIERTPSRPSETTTRSDLPLHTRRSPRPSTKPLDDSASGHETAFETDSASEICDFEVSNLPELSQSTSKSTLDSEADVPADAAVPIVLKFHCPIKRRRFRQGYVVPEGPSWRALDKTKLKRRSVVEGESSQAPSIFAQDGASGIVVVEEDDDDTNGNAVATEVYDQNNVI